MSGGRAGHAPRTRRAQPHEEEEHENHERWLVSYADMVTLLMCLFIVLYAISQVDQRKFDELASGLAQSFGAPITSMGQGASSQPSVFDGYPQPLQVTDQTPQIPAPGSTSAAAAAKQQADVTAEAQKTYAELAAVEKKLKQALAAAGYPDAASFEINEKGLVVHVIADQLLFDAEQADLRPAGRAVLDAIAPVLRGLPNRVDVEGHANSVPVTPGGRYLSNWELSSARASVVVDHLATADGVPAPRLAAVGYSDTRPLLPDSAPTALSVNRRVDVVVLSGASSAANQLLPGLDAAATTQGAHP